MSFAGLRVISLETRRAREIESLIVRQQGIPFVAPSVKERAISDDSVAFQFVEKLENDEFDMVILMTGAGLAFLRDLVAGRISPERLGAALRRVTIVSRGPKPIPVLRALGVPAQIVIPEPNTWREIVGTISTRPERRIAVQEYGRPNLEMNAELEKLGASVIPVALYRWELPDELEPLREAARRIAHGECDVVLFTSSIQLDHLFEIADEMGLSGRVHQALKSSLAVASVGPIMNGALEARGLTPDIVPIHPKMGALVKAAAESATAVLTQKGRTPLRQT